MNIRDEAILWSSQHRQLAQWITGLLGKRELALYFEKQLNITASSQTVIKASQGRMKELDFITIKMVSLTKSAVCQAFLLA